MHIEQDPHRASIDRERHQEIAERAYYRYLARGSQPGFELEDWLVAEHEVTGGGFAGADDEAAADLGDADAA
jgi:hypothetical protein